MCQLCAQPTTDIAPNLCRQRKTLSPSTVQRSWPFGCRGQVYDLDSLGKWTFLTGACETISQDNLSKKGGDAMQTKKQKRSKKVWSTPRLIVHGTVEKITTSGGCEKMYGGSDGYTWLTNPIWCGS